MSDRRSETLVVEEVAVATKPSIAFLRIVRRRMCWVCKSQQPRTHKCMDQATLEPASLITLPAAEDRRPRVKNEDSSTRLAPTISPSDRQCLSPGPQLQVQFFLSAVVVAHSVAAGRRDCPPRCGRSGRGGHFVAKGLTLILPRQEWRQRFVVRLDLTTSAVHR